MDFTGTWKTRGGHIVEVKDGIAILRYKIDEKGNASVADFDLVERLSGTSKFEDGPKDVTKTSTV